MCFLLIFQQTGFAQVAAELNLAGHFTSFQNNFSPDKFRPLHLRSISYNDLNNNFELLLDKGDSKDSKKQFIESATKELLSYFLIGVSLPNQAFRVNLRPDTPDDVIDPLLAQTEIGRILLEADLQLKKDTADATNPQTPEGREYWNLLYKKAGELYGRQDASIPTLTRPWIVPDEIIIRESVNSAYVYKATLKVMLEQDYMEDSATYSFKNEKEKQLNEYSAQIIRENIIPRLSKEVNNSKRYAPLRQVYYSLILAQWFKARQQNKNNQYSRLIDSRDLTGIKSKTPYSVRFYFDSYKENFTKGEYSVKEPVFTSSGQVMRSYFSGGIVLAAPGSALAGELNRPLGAEGNSLVIPGIPIDLGTGYGVTAEVDGEEVQVETPSTSDAVLGETVKPPEVQSLESESEGGTGVGPGLSTGTKGKKGGGKSIVLGVGPAQLFYDWFGHIDLGKIIADWARKQWASFRQNRQRNKNSLSTEQLNIVQHLRKHGPLPVGVLVALQTNRDKAIDLLDNFSAKQITELGRLVAYWNHNISNFIARQFADQQRGIVELISNALDASTQLVSVTLRQGEVIVANGDKGISLKQIFTYLLIPTYSSKSISDSNIGRFGVGFLSALNYLNIPASGQYEGDEMEIVSFHQGKWFRIRLGVQIEQKGRRQQKIILIKSVEEGIELSANEINHLFTGIDIREGGTSIRVRSQQLVSEEERNSIHDAIKERFAYWTGQSLRVYRETRESGMSEEGVSLDTENYTTLRSQGSEASGKRFRVMVRKAQGQGGLAHADKPGQGKLIITLQGVVLREVSIPGSNVMMEVVVNLPASTLIPTSRDRVIIDERTIEAIFNSAEDVRNNSDLGINEKISVLNSLYYLLKWAEDTNGSLVAGRSLDAVVAGVISDYQREMEGNSETAIFVPDTLQAYEFFRGTPNVILVNPKLLPAILFAGKPVAKITEQEFVLMERKLEIYLVVTNQDRPVLRLGGVVFIKDSAALQRSDAIWQAIFLATAFNYWEFMMGQLGRVNNTQFEDPGHYRGVSEEATKKEMVMQFLNKKINQIQENIDSIKIKLADPASLPETGEDSIKQLEAKLGSLEKSLGIFQRLLLVVEQTPRISIVCFHIFKKHMSDRDEEIFNTLLGDNSLFQEFDFMKTFVNTSAFDINLFISSIPLGTIAPEPETETPVLQSRLVPGTNEAAAILAGLEGGRPAAKPKMDMPVELTEAENNLLFAAEVISRWADENQMARDFIDSIQDSQAFQELLQIIYRYRSTRLRGKTEIQEDQIRQLLDYLSLRFINRKQDKQGEASLPQATVYRPQQQSFSGRLADIVASFFRLGRDIAGYADITGGEREDSLSYKAAQGQVQQSINYQDPEEYIFIRELIQNALDAIRQFKQSGGRRSRQISQRIDMQTRLVNDRGVIKLEFSINDPVGMDLAAVLNYLLIPNRSSKETIETLTGFFGHGFFTSLRESETVLIETSIGNGKVIVVVLTPVRNEAEGVITDVEYEIYEENRQMQGTTITWRKRGPADVIDETIVNAKAEMFSRTIDREEIEVTLNGQALPKLNRRQAYLSSFESSGGALSRVYIDAGQPSIVIQRGLFVCRFDRNFIKEVLGIPAESDLFDILLRLAELGVVVDLPEEISLTRDRAHFVKKDFTDDIRRAFVGALFDAAIKAILAGKIHLPYDFGYDFLTEIRTEGLANPLRYRQSIFRSESELNRLISYLLEPDVKLLNIVKNWIIIGASLSLQKFLTEIKVIASEEQANALQAATEFLASAEFNALIDSLSSGQLTEKEVNAARGACQNIIEKHFPGAAKKIIGHMLDSIFSEAKKQVLPSAFIGELEEGLSNLLQSLYLASLKSKVNDKVKGEISKARLLDRFTIEDNGLFRNIEFRQGFIILDKKPDYQALLGNQAVPVEYETPPQIEEDIVENLAARFFYIYPLSLRGVWSTAERSVAAAAQAGETRTASEIKSAEESLPTPLSDSVDIDQLAPFRLRLPSLYFFLMANKAIIATLIRASIRITGTRLYPAYIDISVYYNPQDYALARGGGGGISWNLTRTTLELIQALNRYLNDPSDKNLILFLQETIEVLTHEMTHEEESQKIAGDRETHNKLFFDRQLLNLLKLGLTDKRLQEEIRRELQDLVEKYQAEKRQYQDPFLSSNPQGAANQINRVLRGEQDDGQDHALEGNVTREDVEAIERSAVSSGSRRIGLPADIIKELEQKFGPGRVGPVEVVVVAQSLMHTRNGTPINGPVRLRNRIFVGDEYLASHNNDLRTIIAELGHEAMAQWVAEMHPELTAQEAHELATQMEAIFKVEQRGLSVNEHAEESRSVSSQEILSKVMNAEVEAAARQSHLGWYALKKKTLLDVNNPFVGKGPARVRVRDVLDANGQLVMTREELSRRVGAEVSEEKYLAIQKAVAEGKTGQDITHNWFTEDYEAVLLNEPDGGIDLASRNALPNLVLAMYLTDYRGSEIQTREGLIRVLKGLTDGTDVQGIDTVSRLNHVAFQSLVLGQGERGYDTQVRARIGAAVKKAARTDFAPYENLYKEVKELDTYTLLPAAQWLLKRVEISQEDDSGHEGPGTTQKPDNSAGIDFRFLPIVTQSLDHLKAGIKTIPQKNLQRMNLVQEMSDLERLVNAGITPSAERLKELLAAICLKGNSSNDLSRIVSCISNILRIEEESCSVTDPELKDILIVLGSGRRVDELKIALLK